MAAKASQYKTEDDYLKAILKYVKEIESDIKQYLDYWDLIDKIKISEFKKNLKILKNHIEITIETSYEDRKKFKI